MNGWTGLMTKLQAVNICLNSVGASSVEDVDAGGPDAQMAADLIEETSAYIQSEGWTWNREVFKLVPDKDKHIYLPANTINVDSVGVSKNIDVIQRGQRLYNKAENSYEFPQTEIYVECIMALPWTDLPQAVRIFIAASSALVFQQRILSSESLDKFLEQKAKDAWIKIVRADMRDADYNMLKDNWSTASVVERAQFNRGAYL